MECVELRVLCWKKKKEEFKEVMNGEKGDGDDDNDDDMDGKE